MTHPENYEFHIGTPDGKPLSPAVQKAINKRSYEMLPKAEEAFWCWLRNSVPTETIARMSQDVLKEMQSCYISGYGACYLADRSAEINAEAATDVALN